MTELLSALPRAEFIAFMAVLGLLIGSFLNVVVYRLPVMMVRGFWADAAIQLGDEEGHQIVFEKPKTESIKQVESELEYAFEKVGEFDLARPASRCPHCGHRIRAWENVPVLSWLFLRGKCSACKAPISVRYPLGEAAVGAMFAVIAWRFGPGIEAFLWCGFASFLTCAALIDWDTTLMPDVLTLPLLWAGLAASACGWIPLEPAQAIAGAAAGYLFLWAPSQIFLRVMGKMGMANGDFKLLAAIGAWTGPMLVIPALLMSCALGICTALLVKAAGRSRLDRMFPLGPALAMSGLAAAMGLLPSLAIAG